MMRRKSGILLTIYVLSCLLMTVPLASEEAFAYPELEVFEACVKGLGRFEILTEGEREKFVFDISYLGKDGKQVDEHRPVKYAHRGRLTKQNKLPPKTEYPQTVLSISCRDAKINLSYYLLPHFNLSRGLYLHEDVEKLMPYWKTIFTAGPEREFSFRFVPDLQMNRTEVYLDGSLAGSLEGVTRVLDVRAVSSAGGKAVEISRTAIVPCRDTGLHELSPLPFRAHDLLKEGASLSIGAGEQVIAGIPMRVWSPEQSMDQGKHKETTTFRDFCWDPMSDRTPWSVGTEYMQWRIPNRPWCYAYVLCAVIPEKGKAPVLGTDFLLMRNGCRGSADSARISLADAESNGNVKQVGTLTYQKRGKAVTTPLYLVRQPMNIARLGIQGQTSPYLDFEFVGCGTWHRLPRSSVQIFGCTLEPSPVNFRMNNPIRGCIFEERDAKAAGFDLVAMRDDVKGFCQYEVYDPLFKTLKTDRFPIQLELAGEKKHFDINLNEWPRGWYGLDITLTDEQGKSWLQQEFSFTVLANDDREAGFESPFAAWPHLKGAHGANPDRQEQLEVMRKAGYHKSWHYIAETEEASGPYQTTLSVLNGFHGVCAICKTREEFDAILDKGVEKYRALRKRYPHCKLAMLLHEDGGREICPEVTGAKKAVRGKYRGWDFDTPNLKKEQRGDWEVFYCTEYAKRIRKEFPDVEIVLGNNSSSCEKVASLVRRGFDLNLVQQLGSEARGFNALPELNAHVEAPGMLWALRETGRVFGYNHLKLNACNEYVFRSERDVFRDWPVRKIMRMTDFAVRDNLISLAFGCDMISLGHLEDVNDSYYDTDWGASGQCKFYPNSNPKRMYTALAVMTRVLDKPVFSRRLPTGEITAYALEFTRNRRVKDVAYALWTPQYGATLAIQFPAGTAVTSVSTFGTETALTADANGDVQVEIGASPCYVIASAPAVSAKVLAHSAPEIPADAVTIGIPSADNLLQDTNPPKDAFANVYAIPYPRKGHFEIRNVKDGELKKDVVEIELKKEGDVPKILWEFTRLNVQKGFRFSPANASSLGIMVKGNSSFAKVMLEVRDPQKPNDKPVVVKLGTEDSYITFEGWQMMLGQLAGKLPRKLAAAKELEVCGIICGSARTALDPVEMAEVTANLRLGPVMVSKEQADDGWDEQQLYSYDETLVTDPYLPIKGR